MINDSKAGAALLFFSERRDKIPERLQTVRAKELRG